MMERDVISLAERRIMQAIDDPCTPVWLRVAMQEAIRRDPVDVVHAFDVAACLFRMRADEAVQIH